MKTIFLFLYVLLFHAPITAQTTPVPETNFWKISGTGIIWNIEQESRLPHADNIEMAGQQVAGIITYTVDENHQLHIDRDIIFPQLRTFNKTTDPDWKDYRAYLRHTFTDDLLPVITHKNKTWIPGPADSVRIEGKLIFYQRPVNGLRLTRTLLPSMRERAFIEKWEIQNVSSEQQLIRIGNILYENCEMGYKGAYRQKVYSDARPEVTLNPGDHYNFAITYMARIDDEQLLSGGFEKIESERDSFLAVMKNNLILKTPDPVLNTLFYFSKIRAAENLFITKMGLVHSPGGSNYYAGIWANDQAEYSGPFFPFLGYADGNLAAYNCYKTFLNNIPKDFKPITSSFEIEGELTCCGKDRGDAAMIAFGTAQFALLRGDKNIALELWPLIEWCLEYCHQKKNDRGVIQSATDEMEGRISTGDANLATSSLYYGGIKICHTPGKGNRQGRVLRKPTLHGLQNWKWPLKIILEPPWKDCQHTGTLKAMNTCVTGSAFRLLWVSITEKMQRWRPY